MRGQHAPADPALDPGGAVARAARQPVLSLEHADAPLLERRGAGIEGTQVDPVPCGAGLD
jgi:hypothetical protein